MRARGVLFVVFDGLPDESSAELNNLTPLQRAKTPFFDNLMKNSLLFLLEPVFSGKLPNSEQGHFALFGYDPVKRRIKRGYISALSAGFSPQEKDLCFRANIASLDIKTNRVIDRRAGRFDIPPSLVKKIDGMEIKGIKIRVKKIKEHRMAVVLKGKGLSDKIMGNDPKYELAPSHSPFTFVPQTTGAKKTAKVLEEFVKRVHEILERSPENIERKKTSGLPANFIILRGGCFPFRVENFNHKYGFKNSVCVAGHPLQKAIAKLLGMRVARVPGANDSPDTNIRGKIMRALRALKEADFVFLHFKATDTLAEDGKALEKARYIERVNYEFEKLWQEQAKMIIITSDHGTSSVLKSHFPTPIPALVWNKDIKGLDIRFTEKSAKEKGEKIKQTQILSRALSLLKVK